MSCIYLSLSICMTSVLPQGVARSQKRLLLAVGADGLEQALSPGVLSTAPVQHRLFCERRWTLWSFLFFWRKGLTTLFRLAPNSLCSLRVRAQRHRVLPGKQEALSSILSIDKEMNKQCSLS